MTNTAAVLLEGEADRIRDNIADLQGTIQRRDREQRRDLQRIADLEPIERDLRAAAAQLRGESVPRPALTPGESVVHSCEDHGGCEDHA